MSTRTNEQEEYGAYDDEVCGPEMAEPINQATPPIHLVCSATQQNYRSTQQKAWLLIDPPESVATDRPSERMTIDRPNI